MSQLKPKLGINLKHTSRSFRSISPRQALASWWWRLAEGRETRPSASALLSPFWVQTAACILSLPPPPKWVAPRRRGF